MDSEGRSAEDRSSSRWRGWCCFRASPGRRARSSASSKDASGAVIPGVTVEAASPELIEKVRSVVTDERGAYQIRELRPGIYTVTFSLPGFATVKRDDIELPTDFTATVNAEMRVGALEETVTVSGASPVVDVQSATKAAVMTREMLDAIPTGRTAQSYGQLVTGRHQCAARRRRRARHEPGRR